MISPAEVSTTLGAFYYGVGVQLLVNKTFTAAVIVRSWCDDTAPPNMMFSFFFSSSFCPPYFYLIFDFSYLIV